MPAGIDHDEADLQQTIAFDGEAGRFEIDDSESGAQQAVAGGEGRWVDCTRFHDSHTTQGVSHGWMRALGDMAESSCQNEK